MSLSEPKIIHGVHSLTCYSRSTFEPYGIIKVLGSLQIAMSGGFNDLYGGSSRYPWASEPGVIDTTLTGVIKELPNFAFEKFLGASVTANAADASGSVGTLTNKYGTSVVDSDTGIASIAVISGEEDELKTGMYVFKAASATTVEVFCLSDQDFAEGTNETYDDDTLEIADSPITVTASTTADLDSFGLRLTFGTGTIAMTTGDTAYCLVRKINGGSDIITIGASTQDFPEFGAMICSQVLKDGSLFEGRLHKCVAIGLPIGLTEKEWLNANINIKCLYDATENAVMTFRRIIGA